MLKKFLKLIIPAIILILTILVGIPTNIVLAGPGGGDKKAPITIWQLPGGTYDKDQSTTVKKYSSSQGKATVYGNDKTHITVFPTVRQFEWNKTIYTVGLEKGGYCDKDALLYYLQNTMIGDEYKGYPVYTNSENMKYYNTVGAKIYYQGPNYKINTYYTAADIPFSLKNNKAAFENYTRPIYLSVTQSEKNPVINVTSCTAEGKVSGEVTSAVLEKEVLNEDELSYLLNGKNGAAYYSKEEETIEWYWTLEVPEGDTKTRKANGFTNTYTLKDGTVLKNALKSNSPTPPTIKTYGIGTYKATVYTLWRGYYSGIYSKHNYYAIKRGGKTIGQYEVIYGKQATFKNKDTVHYWTTKKTKIYKVNVTGCDLPNCPDYNYKIEYYYNNYKLKTDSYTINYKDTATINIMRKIDDGKVVKGLMGDKAKYNGNYAFDKNNKNSVRISGTGIAKGSNIYEYKISRSGCVIKVYYTDLKGTIEYYYNEVHDKSLDKSVKTHNLNEIFTVPSKKVRNGVTYDFQRSGSAKSCTKIANNQFKIKANGAIFRVYYKTPTAMEYTVVRHYQDMDGNEIGKTESPATLAASANKTIDIINKNTYNGNTYFFKSSKATLKCNKNDILNFTITSTGAQIDVYYLAARKYTVRYYYDGMLKKAVTGATTPANKVITVEDKNTVDGKSYTLNKITSTNVTPSTTNKFRFTQTKSNAVINVYYRSKYAYKVQYYYSNGSGAAVLGKELTKDAEPTGNSVVTVDDAPMYMGITYTLQRTEATGCVKNSNFTYTIKNHGDVIKLYYVCEPDEAYNYTIHYYFDDVEDESLRVTGITGKNNYVTVEEIEREGYARDKDKTPTLEFKISRNNMRIEIHYKSVDDDYGVHIIK